MFHVKQFDELSKLNTFLKTESIILSEQQIVKLKIYLTELIQFAAKHRIISINDIDNIVSRHFLSSFYFVKNIKDIIKESDEILDLGSGAGFPGIVLSIYLPNRVTLVDSNRKKSLFLSRIKKELSLNCEVINERIENFVTESNRQFTLITARALASIGDLIDLTSPLLNKSVLHTIKGLNFREELSGNEAEYLIIENTIADTWIKYSEYLNNKIYISISSK